MFFCENLSAPSDLYSRIAVALIYATVVLQIVIQFEWDWTRVIR